jgi:O-methyltransferase
MNKEEIYLLIKNLRQHKISMVFEEEFFTILNNKLQIDQLNGDIVECGCWRGGFSIFLAKLFPNKKVWVLDSFQGFQDPFTGKYQYPSERHTPNFTHNMVGPIAIPYEETRNNFIRYGLEQDLKNNRINIIQGFVKETTDPSNLLVKDISVLRIDVDAYSATMEILDNLYHKVIPNGYIIFDDSGLRETKDAMKDFFVKTNLPMEVLHPTNFSILDMNQKYTTDDSGLPPGCFIIKPSAIKK